MNWFETETCINVNVQVDEVFQGDIWVYDEIFEGLFGHFRGFLLNL
jgi:hypothetical protein